MSNCEGQRPSQIHRRSVNIVAAPTSVTLGRHQVRRCAISHGTSCVSARTRSKAHRARRTSRNETNRRAMSTRFPSHDGATGRGGRNTREPAHAEAESKRADARLSFYTRNVDQHARSEEHTSELQSPCNLVCRLLLEKKKKHNQRQCNTDRPNQVQTCPLAMV